MATGVVADAVEADFGAKLTSGGGAIEVNNGSGREEMAELLVLRTFAGGASNSASKFADGRLCNFGGAIPPLEEDEALR